MTCYPAINEATLRRIAHIIGPYSASAQALTRIAEIRKEGGKPVAFQSHETIVVVNIAAQEQGESDGV